MKIASKRRRLGSTAAPPSRPLPSTSEASLHTRVTACLETLRSDAAHATSSSRAAARPPPATQAKKRAAINAGRLAERFLRERTTTTTPTGPRVVQDLLAQNANVGKRGTIVVG